MYNIAFLLELWNTLENLIMYNIAFLLELKLDRVDF